MTNPATPRRTEPAIGNGVATSFPFTFKVFSGADIGVVRTLLATGVDEALTLDVDYSVTLNPDQDASPGGTVTYPISGSPLSASYSFTIFGDTDYTQDLDLSAGGNFNPVNIENALDRLSFQIQQLLEQLSRTLTLAVSSGSTTDLTLPSPVANGLIGWDSLAMGLQNVDPSTLATLVAYGAAQRDYFVGDGVTTAFALSANPGALGNIDIDIDGVTQHGDTDFSWSGGLNLVFTSPPTNLAKIQVRYLQALPVGTVGASTVGTTQLVDGSVTTVKLSTGAVTNAKLGALAVTDDKVNDVAYSKLSGVPANIAAVAGADAIQRMSLVAQVASTSGTAVTFTGIPTWAKKITIALSGVSTNGSSPLQLQIGSGSILTTGYMSGGTYVGGTNQASGTNSGTGVVMEGAGAATILRHGHVTLTHMGSNLWAVSGVIGRQETAFAHVFGGSNTLAGVLDRLQLTTVSGADTFDAGVVSLLIEG